MVAKSELIDTVNAGPQGMFLHGLTFGGRPTACAAGLANIEIMEREDIIGNVRRTEGYFRAQVRGLLDHPLVGDVRGDGFHYSLELVTDKDRREWDSEVAAVDFVSTTLGPALIDAGVLCRAAVDHEGTPLVQFSPPLVFTREDIDTLVTRVRAVLDISAAHLEMAD